MKAEAASEWERRALCVLETPDAPELWGPDRRPPMALWVHLEQMCQRCPVIQECAGEAVSRLAESGVYAGVWVPKKSLQVSWESAMGQLERIAGVEPIEVSDEALGVPA